MNTNNLDRLQRAKENQDRAIQDVVLKLLHLNGFVAFDMSKAELDEDTEAMMPTPPAENWN